MKIKLSKWLLAVSCALSFLVISAGAEAHCRWVGGYWHNGHHYAGHRVCYHRHYGCRWVGGHYRNGHWIRRHKVCN